MYVHSFPVTLHGAGHKTKQVPDLEAGGSGVQEDPGRLWGTQLKWLSGDTAGRDIGVRAR